MIYDVYSYLFLISDCVRILKTSFDDTGIPIDDDNITFHRLCQKLEYLVGVGLKGTILHTKTYIIFSIKYFILQKVPVYLAEQEVLGITSMPVWQKARKCMMESDLSEGFTRFLISPHLTYF